METTRKLILPHLSEALFFDSKPNEAVCPILLDDKPHETIEYDATNRDHVAGVITTRILRSLDRRSGFDNVWGELDDDLKLEIFNELKDITFGILPDSL